LDLAIRDLGSELRSPIVASAGPFANSGARCLTDAGVGAMVLASLFEEQFRAGSRGGGARAARRARRDPRDHPVLVEKSAEAVPTLVISSLNGCPSAGWTGYAEALEQAAAAAIELNPYLPQADPLTLGREIEQRHIEDRVRRLVTA
jgi:dihydroorotate dehydrogenase (fumarate)